MDFNEKIGDYTIIKHGEIIVYKNETINIELIEESGTMVLKVMFVQEDNSRPYITEELNKNTLIMKFVNSNRDYSVSGIFAPIEIGKLGDGEVLYFCCSVFTINAKDGNRLFKYSFLKRI